MMDSQTLLAEYVKNGSEPAFRELVGCYVGLVYSTARRLVGGDTHLAEDVAQIVFADLARTARTLSQGTMLGGWLHRDTCFVAGKIMRGERRRQSRERQAAEMNALNDAPDAALAEIAPVLDEAINQLGEQDRAAILLRFFEQRDLCSVGQAMGVTENAVQKRITRALEKLHILLKHRGVAFSAPVLAKALATEAAVAPPVGLAASIVASALTTPAAGGGTALTLFKIATMTKLKFSLLSLAVVAVVAVSVRQQRQTERLRSEIMTLRQSSAELADLRAENKRLAEALSAEAQRPKVDNRELLRLRGQVGLLRQAAQENPRLQSELDSLTKKLEQTEASRSPGNEKNPEQQMLMAKSVLSTAWGHALLKFAKQNDGQLPSNLTAAAPYLNNNELLPDNWRNAEQISTEAATNGVTIDQFELVYQGSMTNVQDPAHTILLREKEPLRAADGRWARTYVTANGFGGVRWSDTQDFTAVEKDGPVQQRAP